jgi:exopolysaccharide biosynthesis predicted pyruvyltransferase EpsI
MQGNKAKAKAIKDWSKFDEITFLADGTFADLVKAIHHSEFVFTDSFHGACLSVIFEKPFICCPKSQRGNSRFALFNQLGLGDRISTRESPNIELITQNIDWNLVRDKLNTMRCDSFSWLSESFGKDFGDIESMLTGIKK